MQISLTLSVYLIVRYCLIVFCFNYDRSEIRQLPSIAKPSQCKPVQRIVYLKTHKTGSTTVTTTFQRYGYTRNLTFALPKMTLHMFPQFRPFMRNDVLGYSNNSKNFDMLVNHAMFNRSEMEKVIPRAVFFTTLRDPVSQFESAFAFYRQAERLGIKTSNPISTFLSNPKSFRIRDNVLPKDQLQNGQLYDLGLRQSDFNDTFEIKQKIKQLENEFDLVMITEYMDESFILLKRMLCWETDDIVYAPKLVRTSKSRYNMSGSTRMRILEWNHGDVLLHDHFNQTLWRKIREYGPGFRRDLNEFRNRMSKITTMCSKEELDHDNVTRPLHPVRMKEGAPELCKNLYREAKDYAVLFRVINGYSLIN